MLEAINAQQVNTRGLTSTLFLGMNFCIESIKGQSSQISGDQGTLSLSIGMFKFIGVTNDV